MTRWWSALASVAESPRAAWLRRAVLNPLVWSRCDQHATLAHGRPALAAINLVADLAMISAVANDVGFEHVFVRQVIAQGKAGDGLVGISTSGNSSNLISAFAKAKEMELVTIGLSGGDGGKMKSSGVCDHILVVPTTSIHRIQECHVTAYHILWDLVHTLLADDRGSATAKEAAA